MPLAIQDLATLSDSIEVKAGVRNPDKPEAAELAKIGSNVSVIAADPLNKEDITKAAEVRTVLRTPAEKRI